MDGERSPGINDGEGLPPSEDFAGMVHLRKAKAALQQLCGYDALWRLLDGRTDLLLAAIEEVAPTYAAAGGGFYSQETPSDSTWRLVSPMLSRDGVRNQVKRPDSQDDPPSV